ncbi:host-nuclease inhibitor Gam family protein [Paenibacillus dendritiformis]|uniref:host-nuclease inhibitor Gam family protein n=1 Tax=Paenibacillus dendritiformis TaxID=130049 RepID=UPI0015EC50AA|nr:host-nuclease inhibitor Gam family protein [Paenibacillus dendritiformis]
MAKKKTKSEPVFKSWDEVNQALRDLIEIDQHVQVTEATMNNEINQLKQEAEAKTKPLLARKETLEKNIQAFTESRIEEFTETKTKSLTFGEVGFRKATSIAIRNAKAVLAALKLHNMHDCIKTTETIEKDELGKYSDTALAKIGAKRVTKDKFFMKPDIERIEAQ